eukprot:superscaffoldBa00000333_g3868
MTVALCGSYRLARSLCRVRLAAISAHQAAADWTAPLLRRLQRDAAEQRRHPHGVERTEPPRAGEAEPAGHGEKHGDTLFDPGS